jgi:hypothetical protein
MRPVFGHFGIVGMSNLWIAPGGLAKVMTSAVARVPLSVTSSEQCSPGPPPDCVQ